MSQFFFFGTLLLSLHSKYILLIDSSDYVINSKIDYRLVTVQQYFFGLSLYCFIELLGARGEIIVCSTHSLVVERSFVINSANKSFAAS